MNPSAAKRKAIKKNRDLLNKINNNFASQALQIRYADKINKKLHCKDFDSNVRKELSPFRNKSSVFLPPLTKVAKKALKINADIILAETTDQYRLNSRSPTKSDNLKAVQAEILKTETSDDKPQN